MRSSKPSLVTSATRAAGALEQRVRRNRRAVREHADVGTDLGADLRETPAYSRRRIDAIRQHLHVRAGLVDHVGERSAGVDANTSIASGAHRGEPTNVRAR